MSEWRVKNQKRTFCSKKCADKGLVKKRLKRKCDFCGSEFEFLESRLKHSNRRFCSRECTDSFKKMYGTGKTTTNISFFKNFTRGNACELCSFIGSTDIHHIDGDRTNNTKENFIEACKTCHMRIHRISQRHNIDLVKALSCYKHTIDLPRGKNLKRSQVHSTYLAEFEYLKALV